MSPMRYLVVTLRTATFDPAVLGPHREFLAGLRAQGALEMAGPFTDRSGGAYVLRTDSLDEARAIAARDPLATGAAATIEVREWNAA